MEYGSLERTQKALEEALYYVELGLPIIPICPPDHRGMGDAHKEACGSPGKSPIIPKWSTRGVPSAQEVQDWFRANSCINIGLVLGDTGDTNLVGIDTDGTLGEALLKDWSKGVLPPTWEYTTNAGRRLLYRLPDGLESKKSFQRGGAHEELALLAYGQQTILPPSVHVSGKVYVWTPGKSPREVSIADAPQWVISRVQLIPLPEIQTPTTDSTEYGPSGHKKTVSQNDWSADVPEGGRNNHLAKLTGALLARHDMPLEQVKTVIKDWNQRRCIPPLPEAEIDVMVENLAVAEGVKHSRRPKKRQGRRRGGAIGIRPVPVAELFVRQQTRQGYSWRYNVTRGVFFTCNNIEGPWMLVDVLYVQKKVRKLLIEQNDSWDTMHYVNEVVNALKEVLADLEHDDIFDIGLHPDFNSVYVGNGILDWRTGTLRPWEPSCYSTIKLNVDWDPSLEEDARWLQVLTEWVPDEGTRTFLQEYIGCCLTPDTSFRTAVFLFGGALNGKSIFLDVVSSLFGNHCIHIPLNRIPQRFDTADLVDKLINICGDIDPTFMEETGVLKALISGDVLRGEYKYGKTFDFVPVARLLFSSNSLPKSADKSEGWYTRWKFIEFPNKFAVDPVFKKNLMAYMTTPRALGGLLIWAVGGLRRLHKQGRFTESASMREAALEYRVENDSVVGFFEECLVATLHEGSTTTLATSSAHQAYQTWCELRGLKPVGQIEFSKRLASLGVKRDRRKFEGTSAMCFLGVKFSEYARAVGLVAEYAAYESAHRTLRREGSK